MRVRVGVGVRVRVRDDLGLGLGLGFGIGFRFGLGLGDGTNPILWPYLPSPSMPTCGANITSNFPGNGKRGLA